MTKVGHALGSHGTGDGHAASAQDCRAEIMEHVMDRCYRMTIQHRFMTTPSVRNSALTQDHAIRVLKDAPHSERLVQHMEATVSGRNLAERKHLYDIAFVNCFLNGVG